VETNTSYGSILPTSRHGAATSRRKPKSPTYNTDGPSSADARHGSTAWLDWAAASWLGRTTSRAKPTDTYNTDGSSSADARHGSTAWLDWAASSWLGRTTSRTKPSNATARLHASTRSRASSRAYRSTDRSTSWPASSRIHAKFLRHGPNASSDLTSR
jgi:hypothetical protein